MVASERIIKLPHGVELRALSSDSASALRADFFEVEICDNVDDDSGLTTVSEVIHIRATDLPSKCFPLELKMRYEPSKISNGGALADDLELLAFQRAPRPGEPFELVDGGTFSSAGYATIEVRSFSFWRIVKEKKEKIQKTIIDEVSSKLQTSKVKLLWGTANLFSNRRYMAGAATNPDPDVFQYAAAQV